MSKLGQSTFSGSGAVVVLAGMVMFVAVAYASQVPVPECPAPVRAIVNAPGPSFVQQKRDGDSVAAEVLLRFAGSNTLGSHLIPDIAKEFLFASCAELVRTEQITRRSDDAPETRVIGEYEDHKSRNRQILISARGSEHAFIALADERLADIGMSSEKITDTQAKSLAGSTKMFDTGYENVIAFDGVAVIVPVQNTETRQLSISQLRDIFSGRITDWGQVGRQPCGGQKLCPIHLFARNDASGTYHFFKKKILADRTLSPFADRFENSQSLVAAVASTTSAIGFVGSAYVTDDVRAVAVSETGLSAVSPTKCAIKQQSYPLSRPLYLYSARSNDAVREFIEFAKSPQGQAIVRQNGFFDLSAAQCAGTGSRQRGLHGANQLSRVFRFRSNRATLDAQATDALDVVASTLRDLFDFSKVEIIVAGYADSTGTEDNDLILSKQRAETVKNELVKRNVEVTQILHFGHASPVALNDTEEGRALNRRVEVWIRRR